MSKSKASFDAGAATRDERREDADSRKFRLLREASSDFDRTTPVFVPNLAEEIFQFQERWKKKGAALESDEREEIASAWARSKGTTFMRLTDVLKSNPYSEYVARRQQIIAEYDAEIAAV